MSVTLYAFTDYAALKLIRKAEMTLDGYGFTLPLDMTNKVYMTRDAVAQDKF